ncbi:MAG: NYN domain-containing protein [Candidatus Pacebacteria bacterium]|nr:NYN domain-containing protein [Candidatus Paceibacterota bacterium]
MQKQENNFAFIDSQNIHKGVNDLGWNLDWKRFRIYLKEKYGIKQAFLFIGYIKGNKELYSQLKKAGFNLEFKPVLPDKLGKPKGNIDADLVLKTILNYDNFDKAVIISSDGDFYSLVEYLYNKKKLKVVLSPHTKTCSFLLKKTAKEKIIYMNNLKNKIGIKRKSTATRQNR